MDEDVPSSLISPLPMEYYFHPLSYTDGEEDARRIVAIPPPLLFIRYVPPLLDVLKL